MLLLLLIMTMRTFLLFASFLKLCILINRQELFQCDHGAKTLTA